MPQPKHWPKEQSEFCFCSFLPCHATFESNSGLINFDSVNYVNAQDHYQTPLQACVISKKRRDQHWFGIETAELLILNGAKLNNIAQNDTSILDTARQGHADPEMVQYLIARIN